MVCEYKRKTNRQSWDEENMRKAIEAVMNKRMGFMRASTSYDVPKSTLERRVRLAINDQSGNINTAKKGLGRFKPVFNKEQEDELSTYVKSMQARLFGLTGKELRILAFELAAKDNISNLFNVENGMEGQDWLDGFLKRYPDILYRRPEPTSAARAMAFNKVAVDQFFDLLEKAVDQHKITPNRIYNVDETGISTVPKSYSKILSLKGQKQVGCLTSGERGQLVTVEICFSGTGVNVPPMIIFPRKRMKNELMDGAPPGAWGVCSDSGWINFELFLTWFKSFVAFTKPSKEEPVLLLLDGHASHIKNLEVIDYAREHHVVLLCTPPHCTHKLQPLDVAFMKPLSTYYSAEVKKWLRSNPGRVVTPFQVSEIFGKAYLQAATMLTAINGYKKCGIWPVDKNVFTDVDYLAAETTNTESIGLEVTNEPVTSGPSTSLLQAQSIHQTPENLPAGSATFTHQVDAAFSSATSDVIKNLPSAADIHQMPSSSTTFHVSENLPATPGISQVIVPTRMSSANPQFSEDSTTVSVIIYRKENTSERQIFKPISPFLVSPQEVLSFPKQKRTEERQRRKRGKTAILTESPYKNELLKEKEYKENKKKKIKRTTTKQKNKKRKLAKKNESSSKEEAVDDSACIYCGYLYSQSSEGWTACNLCHGWAHNSCAGVDEEDDEYEHICDHCSTD